MISFRVLLLATILVIGQTVPILEGADVGKIKKHLNKTEVVNSAKFPYVVHLTIEVSKKLKINSENFVNTTEICGGVIVTDDVILTAAHCLDDPSKKIHKIWAWAGIVDTAKENGIGQKIAVKYYKQHENYVRGYQFGVFHPNDIAIIWLENKFKIDGKYIKLATFPEEKLNFQYKHGLIIGWGLKTNGQMSSMLQKATMRVISQKKCDEFHKQTVITDEVICVLSKQNISINCKGDSGSPFIVEDKVVGLSSFAGKMTIKKIDGTDLVTCDPKKPGIYTNVSKYLNWIKKQLTNGAINKVI